MAPTQTSLLFGDLRALDLFVLPGDFELNVNIETESGVSVDELKVEQTYTVTVSLPEDCTLGDYDALHFVVELPGYNSLGVEGWEIVAQGDLTDTVTSMTIHNVTPWRAGEFRVRAWLDFYGSASYGPKDMISAGYTYRFKYKFLNLYLIDRDPLIEPGDGFADSYDCYFEVTNDIVPEDITPETGVQCISRLDQRWPNVWFKISNNDNPEDVDDPTGQILDDGNEDIFAWINASGGGIKNLSVGLMDNDSTGSGDIKRYILQLNDDNTVTVWEWPGDIPLYGPAQPDGTTLSTSSLIKYYDKNGNNHWDEGDPIFADIGYISGVVDAGDLRLYAGGDGEIPSSSTLSTDSHLQYVDVDGSGGWTPGCGWCQAL